MKKWFTSAGVLLILVTLGLYSKPKFCAQYPTHRICAAPSPTPEPTPVPTAIPTPVPEPTALPTATPSPVPTATPPATTPPFPVRFPVAGSTLYMNNHRYGNGVDSTVRVRGDRELCEALHHVPVPSGDCHFDSDVWRYSGERAAYERTILGGCPVWQVRGLRVERCHDDQNAQHSCDHFGNTVDRDDPKTPVFEGKPVECGLQVDEFGPYAGFFMIPQRGEGSMEVRACKPSAEGDDSTCGPWKLVDWK